MNIKTLGRLNIGDVFDFVKGPIQLYVVVDKTSHATKPILTVDLVKFCDVPAMGLVTDLSPFFNMKVNVRRLSAAQAASLDHTTVAIFKKMSSGDISFIQRIVEVKRQTYGLM